MRLGGGHRKARQPEHGHRPFQIIPRPQRSAAHQLSRTSAQLREPVDRLRREFERDTGMARAQRDLHHGGHLQTPELFVETECGTHSHKCFRRRNDGDRQTGRRGSQSLAYRAFPRRGTRASRRRTANEPSNDVTDEMIDEGEEVVEPPEETEYDEDLADLAKSVNEYKNARKEMERRAARKKDMQM